MTKHVVWWLSHEVTSGSSQKWPVSLIVALGCVFLAILLAGSVLIGVLGPDNRTRRLADRIGRYGPRQASRGTESFLTRLAGHWVAPFLALGETGSRLALRLDLAGMSVGPAEWVLAGTGLSVVLALVLTSFLGNPVIGVIAGILGGWLGMRFGLSFKISRRRAKFSEQLPDVLQFLAGSLRTGFSLAQGLDAAVREDTQPTASEFARALADSRIGVELEDALDQIANRMDSADLRWTVIAIRIQREVGGNLAEVLGNTVETMRERAQLRRHVKALSAEGRLSAYILVALPIFVTGWLYMTRRSYIAVLWTTTVGIFMLIFAIVMIVAGAFWMRAMVRVEV
jgi:Flp pilus assembly protein TadB